MSLVSIRSLQVPGVARRLLVAALAATAVAHAVAEMATPSASAAPSPGAGDLTATADPDRSPAEIARLRAAALDDPAVVDALIAELATRPAGPGRDALAATIDRVAAQRYATVSGLVWHTELATAQQAAHRTGKPILSLRMLGRLDEDLSCANSRFFRTMLYADRALSTYLRDHFVLLWTSVRPVPRVTIDFGDGRRLERTVTGNSGHHVLDADGRPVDVLPGLYAPTVFQAELERARVVALELANLDDSRRAARLQRFHRDRLDDRDRDWRAVGSIPVLTGGRRLLDGPAVDAALALAQRAAMMKARVEVPDLRIIDVGADPGTGDQDVPFWASVGQRMFGIGGLPVMPASALFGMPRPPSAGSGGAGGAGGAAVLDAQSRALVTALIAAAPSDAGVPRVDVAQVVAAAEQAMVADTALNELRLHRQIRTYFIDNPEVDFATLDAWIYREVFHTPSDDAWLGLLPRTTYSGLAGDGVVVPR
jgi:hypothetical protein